MQSRTIYLIGPMGAGKSTIGRMLSRELNLPFLDTDQEVEDRCGADIPWIFDREGEDGFRQRETFVLESLQGAPAQVVATGGGIVMREKNRRLMIASGFVVFLQASVATQMQRTAKDKRRPLLQRPDREQVLADLYELREPLYREAADLVVCTDRGSPRQVIKEITEAVGMG
ncbi:shikimate kinase [Parendozoicomonas haliclonae]|uniref:Shikimate kinase n=1 Tax=Parendozoicomonas haliclonae TaxID=1960125 RepID=A0A1X7AHG0_9GAMM|nr:shikimate kinase [Parendozoicomonas haliclonae]SMA35969.1 Shikimate kinase 1 [Parendozoicomonas haliclonae]